MESLESISSKIISCKLCDLCKSRKNAVPGEGKSNAYLLIIGEAPGRYEDDTGRPFVGMSGKFLNKYLEMVSAFKRTKNPNLELRLYGANPPFKIDDSRIHYFGHVKDKDLPRVLNSFDVFVFPSRWEGFGMPIMEAKKCMVPVITYKKGDLPSIVKAHTLQFKDEKDLTSILEKNKWKKIDTKAAYKDTRKTSPRYVAKQMNEIYHKILA